MHDMTLPTNTIHTWNDIESIYRSVAQQTYVCKFAFRLTTFTHSKKRSLHAMDATLTNELETSKYPNV